MTVRQRRERIQNRNYKKQLRGQYTYGNVVRKTAPQQTMRSRNSLRPVEGGNIRRNTEKRGGITAGYVVFLTLMMCITGYSCFSYLNITSSISNDLTKIAHLETEYTNIKAENDDYENRINGSIDLENIKKKAMTDLHMQYANDDQIVKYESDDTDYVRQYISLE